MTEPTKWDMRLKTGKNVKFCFLTLKKKQSQIHGNSVADGWAGAVMQKPHGIKNVTDGRTDTTSCRVACPRLKRKEKSGLIMRP